MKKNRKRQREQTRVGMRKRETHILNPRGKERQRERECVFACESVYKRERERERERAKEGARA